LLAIAIAVVIIAVAVVAAFFANVNTSTILAISAIDRCFLGFF
jgi:hypothetical protein